MNDPIPAILDAMIEYDQGDPARIHHFLKVHELARAIGFGEGLDETEQLTLEVAAIVHDIGIHLAEERYGSARGEYQEKLGPDEAEKLLADKGLPKDVVERVCFLVGHHHNYNAIAGSDYQILVEADFLVNLFENREPENNIRAAYNKIFVTDTGRRLCRLMFGMR